MRQSNLSWILLLPLFGFLSFIIVSHTGITRAASADHVVISEIQIAGPAAGNDFIELYNPLETPFNLSGMRLVKRTSTGAADSSLVVFASNESIPSHGFYLWCNTSLDATLLCDRNTSGTIADVNSIALRNGSENTGELIDAVTFGDPASPLGEGSSIIGLSQGLSIERKANSNSTIASMTTGLDMLLGNGEDTDNNANDFLLRNIPDPQNSASSIEPAAEPTTTPTPTQEPTSTPTPTLEPTPTDEPEPTITQTPTPTSQPTATPTTEPTNTPTPNESEPTTTPTVTPTPTLIPTNTPVPTITPTISPTPRFPHFTVSCTTRYRSFRFFHTIIQIPMVSCRLLSN